MDASSRLQSCLWAKHVYEPKTFFPYNTQIRPRTRDDLGVAYVTFVDKREEIRPAHGEAPFSFDEVFFSRTDARGVIKSGNYVFRRVAHYPWEKLNGAPHKIIRHPDMPRGVFQLFWDTIQSGQPIAAYVKNRAEDGLFYWVLAVVIPLEDGYLSARIRPSSDLFATVQSVYAGLLSAEADEHLSPKASAARLLSDLKSLGFDSYEKFATTALAKELLSRDEARQNPVDHKVQSLCENRDRAISLTAETAGLIDDFHGMRTIPHNLQVIASRIEPTGGPISTLSKNYSAMSHDMLAWFEKHILGDNNNFSSISGSIEKTLFIESMSRVLQACDHQLTRERRQLGDVDIEAERQILRDVVAKYSQKARDAIHLVRSEADRILDACNQMERHILGLSTTRVMCKIESGRLNDAGEALTDIISQLNVFQDRISARLEKIRSLGADIEAGLA